MVRISRHRLLSFWFGSNPKRSRNSRQVIRPEIIYPHRLGALFHFLLLDRVFRFVPCDNALSSHNTSGHSPDLRMLTAKGHTFGPKYSILGTKVLNTVLRLPPGDYLLISRHALFLRGSVAHMKRACDDAAP